MGLLIALCHLGNIAQIFETAWYGVEWSHALIELRMIPAFPWPLLKLSSRLEEFHLPPLTDPYVLQLEV